VPRDQAPPPPEVNDAVFLAEARDAKSLPAAGGVEIAIAGRSNVGKSTLLNRLASRKALARTSRTPGRTRGIVLFQLTLGRGSPVRDLRLCDLPGYGYAKVSRSERDSWQPLIEGYTRGRPTLALFVVLVDARRGIETEERQLYEWLGSENVPAQIVYTKVDKLSASERGLLRERTKQLFSSKGGSGRRAAPLLVSADTGEGVPELWAAIFSAVTAMSPPLAATPGSA
jgi:GTP-binding protein